MHFHYLERSFLNHSIQKNLIYFWKQKHCSAPLQLNVSRILVNGSALFLAEILVMSSRKLLIFIIQKNVVWTKVSMKYYI